MFFAMDPEKHFISSVFEISNAKLASLLLILLTAYICYACYQAFVGTLAVGNKDLTNKGARTAR